MLRLDDTEDRLTAVDAARFRAELAALVADRLRQVVALLIGLVVVGPRRRFRGHVRGEAGGSGTHGAALLEHRAP